MKNWLTIGQFARESGFSPKALRLYEKMGLIISHARGDNDYRYYDQSQLATAGRIKELKDLGFTLNEVKDLLKVDEELNSEKLHSALLKRRDLISEQADVLRNQKNQVEKILSSLSKKTQPLEAEQRRAIMSFYGNISILVTGTQGLEKTASYIQKHFKNNGKDIPIVQWNKAQALPVQKPYILVCPEAVLGDSSVEEINADVIVVKNISAHDQNLKQKYLRLFLAAGPHVTTVINADDLASVDLAGDNSIRSGRIFYFSKNKALQEQISKIGGVIGQGDDVYLFGFNLQKKEIEFKLDKILALEDEVSYLSSLGAVLTAGFSYETLRP
ncbi:hypothetical protein AZI86_06680 [Bdellovibrio bacteriovorus]|uniref:HTH merR-type domain-containing protein n=1 Tax=Bdellovibrio bacteriovorus TaxID=959 RepID=A0A150WQW9_BDEBC|nr:MerR family transcriptional regulator [Bdellovibrio bacteriovorus]KYG66724.1 hypothetical protein AZI86_06680 [Bdellovibrio bacteriovorus]